MLSTDPDVEPLLRCTFSQLANKILNRIWTPTQQILAQVELPAAVVNTSVAFETETDNVCSNVVASVRTKKNVVEME
jgi:hypothetical protein